MKKIILISALSFLACIQLAHSQSKEEKINISYWYVFGRFPNTSEMNYWKGQPDQAISWYVSNHHNYLRADDRSNSDAVNLSYKDAFGRQPNQGEINFWKQQKRTYADLMNEHVQYLLRDPNENKSTINRAYQAVYARNASDQEMNYWAKSNFSYLLLTACLRSYKSTGYRLQSVEGIVNFMKGAWETTSNFVVNTGSAIYNATSTAITNTIAAGQRILTLTTSKQTTTDLQKFDSKVMTKTENGYSIITGGAAYMKDVSKLINLDGTGFVGPDAGTLIGAGGLN